MNASLLKVFVILFVIASHTTGMRFTVTIDALTHGASSLEVGLMLSSISLVPACFAIAAGRWLDRSGPRGPLALTLACSAVSGAAAFLFPTAEVGYIVLFAACPMVGMALLLVNAIVQRLTGDVSTPETRATAFTFLALVNATSSLVTPIATGYVVEHVGCGAYYAFAAASPVVLGLICLTPAFRAILPTQGRANAKGAGKRRASDFFRMPGMRAVLFVSVMVSVAWEVGELLIPVYCNAVGLSPADIGWVLGSFSAASFTVRAFMPFLARHMREWTMISGTLLIASIAFTIYPLFESKYALMASSFLLGSGLGASYPNIMSLVYRLAPRGRVGEAIGLRLMMLNASKTTFPAAMGAVGAAIGPGAALWALAAFVFGGFVQARRNAPAVFAAIEDLHEAHPD